MRFKINVPGRGRILFKVRVLATLFDSVARCSIWSNTQFNGTFPKFLFFFGKSICYMASHLVKLVQYKLKSVSFSG